MIVIMPAIMALYFGVTIGMLIGFAGIVGQRVRELDWMREVEEDGAWTDMWSGLPDKGCHTDEEFEAEFEAAEEYPVVQPSVRRIEVAAARYNHTHIVMARDLAEIYANNTTSYEVYRQAFMAMGRQELEMTWKRDLAA